LAAWKEQKPGYEQARKEHQNAQRREAYSVLSWNANEHPSEEVITALIDECRADLEGRIGEPAAAFNRREKEYGDLVQEILQISDSLAKEVDKLGLDPLPLLRLAEGITGKKVSAANDSLLLLDLRAGKEPAEESGAGCAQAKEEPGEGAGASDEQRKGADAPKLSPSRQKAYQQWQWAMRQSTELETDQQAYDWLTEHQDEDEQLPSFSTWARYVRDARDAYGTSKHTSRKSRKTGPSIVRQDEI
jgi:hypothetical protein